MDVTSASSQTSGTNSGAGTTGNSGLPSPSALQNEFLQLLTAQLQYQDPLQPMDNTQFTAQLAQFSELDQLSSMNNTMGNLSSSLMSTGASSLIGKYVETASKGFTQVTGASFGNGQTSLMLSDNSSVNLSDVTEIKNSI